MSSLPKLRPVSGELLNVDFLRFVASAGIVAYHSIQYFVPREQREALGERTLGLALFVDLFFVISGFVIAYVYHARVGTAAGYGTFLQRRVGRLVPLHLLTLLVSIVVWGGAVAVGQTANHMPSFDPRCIAQTAVFLHAIVDCGNGIYFNSVSWSIGAEMVMYVLFPAFAWAGQQSRNVLLVATLTLVLATAAVGWIKGIAWEHLWPLSRALPSFLIGVSLFYWRDALRLVPRPNLVLAASLPITIVTMTNSAPDVVSLALVYVVVAAAIAADLQGSVAAVVARFGPLGQLTYSIYMWHVIPVMIVMTTIGDRILHAGTGLMLVVGAACYAIIFVVSYVSYAYFETPARRWIDSWKLFATAAGAEKGARAQPGRGEEIRPAER